MAHHLRNLLLLLSAATVIGIVAACGMMQTYDLRGVPLSWAQALSSSMVYWYPWAVLFPVVLFVARRMPLARDRLAWALPAHLLVGLVVTGAQVTLFAMLSVWWRGLVDRQRTLWDQVVNSLAWELTTGLLVYWGIVLGWHAWRSMRLEARLTRARLDALQSTLRPHFLGNALHALAEVVHEDADAADRMIVRLGALLRAAQRYEGKDLVTFTEELDLLDAYLCIQRARFGDRLRFDVDVADAARDAAVPPLLLQPLAENAVTHGLDQREGVRIGLAADKKNGALEVVLWDDGPGAGASSRDGSGFGLAGTRERLRLLFGAEASLDLVPREPRGTEARLRIPWQSVEKER